MKIIQKLGLFVIISLIHINIYAKERKAIIKVNVLRGESLVTSNVDPLSAESLIHDELKRMGINRVYSQKGNNADLLFIDAFIYQYPADNPTVVLTVRTQNGIHHFGKASSKIFTDRGNATLKLIDKLVSQMPDEFDLDRVYELGIMDLISPGSVSLIGMSSNAITKTYRSKYSLSLNWQTIDPPKFFMPESFNDYFSYCVDFQGIRKELKSGELIINLKLNDSGIFEIRNINSTISLSDKQKSRVKSAIDAIPIWCTKEESYEADLILKIL
ncbi:hypothetical protein [Dyadobacter sp. CY312]|uniref:hypothetical protein n=1 Tax=Dyadobacter sp. CY312 TaxID=2907303 RepID=UPI001F390633|nr:hypothetical protein [Dyadobacter sp. CY312]MCE7041878.1 hypothetical protein [Dyadobacter sp. CY312]